MSETEEVAVIPQTILPPCNRCGGELSIIQLSEQPGYFGGAGFACNSCEQRCGVRPDGSSWETITTIYGTPRNAQDHHDLADGQAKDKIFFSRLRVAAGYQTLGEHMNFVSEMTAAVKRYKEEHPLPTSLWQRIRERIAL